MFLTIWIFLIYIVLGLTQEPPGPWEKYQAILSADLIASFEISDTFHIRLPSPYVQWEEKRVVSQINILKVYHAVSDSTPVPQQIQVLIPSFFEFQEEPEVLNSQTIAYPAFFQRNSRFISALNYNLEHNWYTASSNWAYLSFLPSNAETKQFISTCFQLCPMSEAEALESARNFLDLDQGVQMRATIKGIMTRQGKWRIAEGAEIESARLMWLVTSIHNKRQSVLIDPGTGEIEHFN